MMSLEDLLGDVTEGTGRKQPYHRELGGPSIILHRAFAHPSTCHRPLPKCSFPF